MQFRHPDLTPFRERLPVFTVLFCGDPPHVFNDLARMYATLGSSYWLGFRTSGLPPDKKRLALLGAQRLNVVDPLPEGEGDLHGMVKNQK